MRAYTLILGFIIISVEVLISEQKAGLDWWSFQKITRPEIPEVEKPRVIRKKLESTPFQPLKD